MEITPEQFAKIEHCLPTQRGNVSLSSVNQDERSASIKVRSPERVGGWRA